MIEDLRLKTERAYNYAVYLLSLKLRTEGELREKMKLKKYPPDIINNVIDQLKANKYLNDEQYALVYLENLKKYKSFGYYGIKKKLMEKRLPSNIIESALSEGLGIDEEMIIGKKFKKKFALGVISNEEKQKLAQRMKSRGFRSDVIAKLVF